MLNPQEATLEFKRYLKKLVQIIENQAQFSFSNTRIFNKNRIDDILCCIEASWPEDYKKFLAYSNAKNLKTPFYYKKLLLAVKNRFFLSTSCYAVDYKEAISALTSLMSSIELDMRYINNNESGMF